MSFKVTTVQGWQVTGRRAPMRSNLSHPLPWLLTVVSLAATGQCRARFSASRGGKGLRISRVPFVILNLSEATTR